MALTYEELIDIQNKKKKQTQQLQSQATASSKTSTTNRLVTPINEIAPVKTFTPTTTTKVKTTVNYLDDGYDFGDISKTILGVTAATGKAIGSTLTGSSTAQKQSQSVFDSIMTKKYSSMSYADIEKEYARVTEEENAYKSMFGGKLTNYLTKAGSYLLPGQTGSALRTQSQTDIDKINDLTREKEIISIYRKQRATEEYLGGLSDEQLKLLDNIAESEALEKSAPLSILSLQGGMDANAYYKTSEVGISAGKEARKVLASQLKDKNPNKSDEELNELIDNMVELRKNQVNAQEKATTEAQLKETATEHPVASFLLSRGANILGGFTGLAELYMQSGNEYGLDINAPGFALSNASSTIDEQVQLDHDWKIGGVDAFDLFYKVGTGIVDNVARLAMSGGNSTVAGAMMFTQGTTQSIVEGKKKGYSDAKALTLGLLDGTFEAVSEKISLDAVLKSNGNVLKSLAKSFVAEGSEEITSNWLNRIADEIANGNHSELSEQYESLVKKGYTKAQALAECVLSVIKEDFEAFFVGGMAGLFMGGGVAISNAVASNKATPVELKEKEQKVYDKVVEDLIAKATEENDGKTISKSEEKKIRNEVLRALDRGYIDTEVAEREFGGEDWDNYKAAKDKNDSDIAKGNEVIEGLEKVRKKLQAEYDTLYKMEYGKKTDEHQARQNELKEQLATIDEKIERAKAITEALGKNENVASLKAKLGEKVYEMVKDTKLAESYHEIARNKQRLNVDTTKYKNEYARQTVQKAVESNLFGNSNKNHELIDFAAKISEDRGYVIEFTKTEGLEKLKQEGNKYNLKADASKIEAFVSGEHKTIVVNVDTVNKAFDSLIGHEITHTLETAKSYKALAKAVKSYLGEAEYKKLLESKGKAYEGIRADIEKEIVADFCGERLLTDYEFVKHLSIDNRNVFQKVWDEIKHLCKLATAGSEEARKLEQIRHQFEKAYRESAKSDAKVEGGTKLSIGEIIDTNNKSYGIGVKLDSTLLDNLSPKERVVMVKEYIKELGGEVFSAYDNNGNSVNVTIAKSEARFKNKNGKSIPVNKDLTSKYVNNEVKQEAIALVDELVITSKYDDSNAPLYPHDWLDDNGKNDWEYWTTYIQDKNNTIWKATLNIANTSNGEKILYDIYPIKKAGQSVKSDTSSADISISQNSEKSSGNQYSLSSIGNTFFGDPNVTVKDFENGRYKETEGYKAYVDMCVRNYKQTRADFDEASARASIDGQIEGIVEVAKAAKTAGYDIYDDNEKRSKKDKKKRLLFSSLEPNSDYFTSNDISTECDKRKNFADIYDAIVKREEAMGVPHDKRFFHDIDNYFYIHKVLANKGLTQPCRQCYVESMRKNLAPMAEAFLRLVTESDVNNKANDQLYHQEGKDKGNIKSNNAKLRTEVLKLLENNTEYGLSVNDLTVEMLTTEEGLAQLRIQAPLLYGAFNSFYGQSKPKMPKSATPFRFGELTALLTDSKGRIKRNLVNKINATGGFRLQSYSDFQIQNYTDVLQVLFEAGTLGLSGHAYTKVPAFLDATEGTNLKRNISIFMYKDGNEWKIDKNDSFPYELNEIYDIVNNDDSGNTSIIAVSQNDDMSAWIMANDYVGYGIPFHKSGLKMDTVRDTDVKTDDGRIIKGYSETIDHTKHQSEVWASGENALTKVNKGINIYSFWDFDNADNLSKNELIEKNVKAYIDACDNAGYLPKFRNYVMNNNAVLNKTLQYAKEMGFVPQNATIEDISFEYKGYQIPYGYYKFLGDFGMFTPDGQASPAKTLSLEGYDFDKAVEFFSDSEKLHRNEILQQFANGEERAKYRNSNLTAGELADIVRQKRDEVVDGIVAPVKNSIAEEGATPSKYGRFFAKDVLYQGDESVAPISTVSETEKVAPTVEEDIAPTVEVKVSAESEEGILGEELLGTREPTKMKKGAWSDFVRNFVSKGAVFEKAALKTKNRALEDKYKMWKDRSEAKAQYFMEHGKSDAGSLKTIYDAVVKSGLEREFDLYMKHRLNVDRMKVGKPVFGDFVTAEMSQRTAAQLQAKHPEFKKWAKDVYAYNDYLRGMLVDAGIITKEVADLWAKRYPNYIPLERLNYDNTPLFGKDGIGISAPVKKATGGNTELETLFKTLAHRTTQTFKAVDKNAFAVELKNTLNSNTNTSEIATDEDIEDLVAMDNGLLQPGIDGKNPTFTAFENGARITFEISEEMYKALQPASEAVSREHKWLSVPSKLHKKVLTEYNLFFTARNFPKDAQEVIFNSKHAAKTYANMPVAVAELIKGGEYATEYWENGGKSNTYFDSKENDFLKDDNAIKKALGFVPESISKVNDFVEAIPRLAEYIASRKSGETIDASMLDAARVTTDFSDGGDITKFLNRNGATFLNASVQGFSQQVRNVRQAKAEGFKGIAKLVGKYAMAGLPAILFNSLMWDDDEEYEDLSEYVKDSYYVIAKYGDGQFVRIPKGRTAAVLQEVAEQAYGILTSDEVDWGDAKKSGKAIYESFMNNIAPSNPLENNVIAPIMQAVSNKTWYGEDLVPTRLQDVPAREQFDETTDSISKWLGENTGISPYKINYLLNQYSGFIGDIVLPGLTPEAERGDTSALGNLLAPLKDQFVVDGTIKNRNPSDFYSLKDELNVNANSKDATDEDKLKYKYIESVGYEMSDLYKQKREIQNSNLSDDLKYKQVRDIQEQINAIAKKGLESYENVKIDKKYAKVGGVEYKLNDKGQWQKLYDDEIEKMNDATKILGITPGEYWSNKQEYDMQAFYPEKYAVLQQEGISVAEYKEKYEERAIFYNDDFSWASNNPDKYTFSKAITDNVIDYRNITSELYAIRADKDENGNSISGTAKSKKKDYIWSLDIDDGAKYLLFKNEYNSCDDYNYEIIDYLNSRDDISYDEMKTILISVGFDVDDEGNIFWD